MLREGRWERKIDEKDRFSMPISIRKRFGATGVWAIEAGGHVILCPLIVWRQRLRGVIDLQQFRETWQPFEVDLDEQGRMFIPPHIRGRFGQDVVVMSMGKFLKVFAKNGNRQVISNRERGNSISVEKECFQDSKEAARYFHEWKEVVYLDHAPGKVVGKFRSYSGAFFSFSGEDEHGTKISVRQVPYWKFRPKEPIAEPAANLG